MGLNHKTVAVCDRCRSLHVFVRAAIDDVLQHSWSEEEDLENEDWCTDCVGYKNIEVQDRWDNALLVLEWTKEITTTKDLEKVKEELHPDNVFPDICVYTAMKDVDTVEGLRALRTQLEKELVFSPMRGG